jgi:hypothetical protein
MPIGDLPDRKYVIDAHELGERLGAVTLTEVISYSYKTYCICRLGVRITGGVDTNGSWLRRRSSTMKGR